MSSDANHGFILWTSFSLNCCGCLWKLLLMKAAVLFYFFLIQILISNTALESVNE